MIDNAKWCRSFFEWLDATTITAYHPQPSFWTLNTKKDNVKTIVTDVSNLQCDD